MNNNSSLQASTPFRPVEIGAPVVNIEQRDGCFYLSSLEKLKEAPPRILDRLVYWAEARPNTTFVARRGSDGEWHRISYKEMLQRVRTVAAHLVKYELSPSRPILILSGNDLEHLQMTLAAYYLGVPVCPASPAYSTVATDFAKLKYIVDLLEPGLVMASDGQAYERAICAVIPDATPVVIATGGVTNRITIPFSDFATEVDLSFADLAFSCTDSGTIAKFLFTSGSTKLPKAVITTQGMLTSNQQMLLQTFPEFGIDPPVLVDWLPWNHTFGGSHNVGIVLYNGGTLYLDDGRPTPQHFGETLRNLREIAPTAYLTVPKGWEELVVALEADAALRSTFFSKIKMLFFAGAGLSQAVWNRLDRIAEKHCNERIRIMAGLGMTETAPSCTFTTGPVAIAGYVGLPAPGCEVKLAPVDGKLEARFRGPHVMPGYWKQDDLNRNAFDDEGYYRSGDALCFADQEHPEWGLMFDGRIAEDFKLSTGVFVSVGPLRARVILEGAPYIQDVVVTAPNRQQIGLMVFPHYEQCRSLASMPDDPIEKVLSSAPVRAWLLQLLESINRTSTGTASFVAWAYLVPEPPSLNAGEITDKGSLNQQNVLSRRAELVEKLYNDPLSLCVVAPQPR
ncbi:feruloyl-CoA synthase [Pseudomonas sp. S37]|nr:feruloyl-CoA synthase [Pseudomonas sp. S37]